MYYNYTCDKCEIIEEHKHGMNEKPAIICSKCDDLMRRAYMEMTFILKGHSGWSSKGTATSDPVRKVRETTIGIKKGFEDKVTPEQVEKDFSGKISKKIDKRKK